MLRQFIASPQNVVSAPAPPLRNLFADELAKTVRSSSSGW